MLQELCQWLQDLSWATDLRESEWMFPIIEGTHVIALALSVYCCAGFPADARRG